MANLRTGVALHDYANDMVRPALALLGRSQSVSFRQEQQTIRKRGEPSALDPKRSFPFRDNWILSSGLVPERRSKATTSLLISKVAALGTAGVSCRTAPQLGGAMEHAGGTETVLQIAMLDEHLVGLDKWPVGGSGLDGTIELRKYVDLDGRPGSDHAEGSNERRAASRTRTTCRKKVP